MEVIFSEKCFPQPGTLCGSLLILSIVSYTALSPLECYEMKSVIMFSVQLCLFTTCIFLFLLGIGTLIANNVYDAAYPLHDVCMHYEKIQSSAGVTQETSLHRHSYLLSVTLKISFKCDSNMKTPI